MSKEALKKFLSAMSKEDYVEADKHFPNAVKDALNNCINKNKAKIIDEINATANKAAAESVNK
jgi:hypothetical protein